MENTFDSFDRSLAVVIGAGVGGLTAATVLADHFERVIILEKDTLPEAPCPRKSVAQGAHLHSLLLGGLKILDDLYPGIQEDLLKKGAVTLRAGLDQQIHESGEWLPERDLGFTIVAQSRPLLEHTIAKRTLANDTIEIIQKSRVRQLEIDQHDSIKAIAYDDAHGQTQRLACDFVVDASGLSGILVKQLAKRFDDIDQSEVVESNIAYASAFLAKPEHWKNKQENVLIIPEPSFSAGGALIDIEDDRWVVSLHGRNGLIPPSDFDAWVAFAKDKLPDERIWQRVKDAKLLGEIKTFRKPKSTWRRFDKVEHLPAGYFPLGDTISSVNPIFGQGMTVAFGHTVALGAALSQYPRLDDAQSHYIKQACAWSEKAWRRSSAYDSTFAVHDEKQQKHLAIMKSLAMNRQRKAHDDPKIHEQLVKQGQMLI